MNATVDSTLVMPGRVVPASEGVGWIGEGWRIFARAPFMWILSMIVSFIIFFILGMIPFIGSIAAFILKAILFAGFMVASDSLARGGDFELEHLFAGFRTHLGKLVILALIVLACVIAIFAVTLGFIAVTVGIAAFTSGTDDLMTAVAASSVFILAAALLMLVLMLPLLMAYWFAPALIVLNGVSPGEAMKASFSASLRNIGSTLVYGVVMLALGFAALIPIFLGLLVWVPLGFTSTYAAYRSIFTVTRQDRDAAPA